MRKATLGETINESIIYLVKRPTKLALIIAMIIFAVRLNIHIEWRAPEKKDEKVYYRFAISMSDLDDKINIPKRD